MKALLYSLVAGTGLLVSCAKDNVDPPSSTLSGRIVYQDQVVGVRSNASQDLGNRSTMLELWQPGYQFFEKFPIFVNQDGTFTATLFVGDYQLVRTRGNGPWVDNTDTIEVQVRGNTVLDVPVQPYFTISTANFQRSGDTAVIATCRIKREVTDSRIDQVALFVSSTQFVDNVNNVIDGGRTKSRNILPADSLTNLNKDLSLKVILPAARRRTVYVRIGVRAADKGEFLFTPVQKLE